MLQQSTYVVGESYTSARATPELVGRETELQQIEAAIRDTEHSYLIYLTGGGGIGKSRLVRHVLNHPPTDVPIVVASQLIDLYHTRTHSLSGLIDAILGVLPPLPQYFGTIASGLQQLAQAELESFTLGEIAASRNALTQKFVEAFEALSRQYRVVIALDTTERLHVNDPAREALHLAAEYPASFYWFLHEFLPNVSNVVVLLAGRPESDDLPEALRQIEGKRFQPIELRGLSESQALQYFDAVAAAARANGDAATANIVDQLPKPMRQSVFYCLCDTETTAEPQTKTIRPILLALAIDSYVVAGRVPPELDLSIDEAEQLQPEQRRAKQEQLGTHLVEMIRDNRRHADDIIAILAWLPKGAHTDLLCRIEESSRDRVRATLDKIKDLSFVKVREDDKAQEGDGRVFFLHDEMYALLQGYTRTSMPVGKWKRIGTAVQEYYEEQIEEARHEIARLYSPLTDTTSRDARGIINARATLQDALVEDLYYRLHWGAAVGFQTYFRYAEEAVLALDNSLDMQLSSELMNFLAEQDSTEPEIDGLQRDAVIADATVRWVKRLIARGEYPRALEIAQDIRADKYSLIGNDDLAKAELDTWEGLTLAYSNRLSEAEPMFERAVESLDQMTGGPGSKRKTAISARAHNNRGYAARVRGQIDKAISEYGAALPGWRSLGMEAEHANTLNNLAYALAFRGDFDAARRLAEDALELRESLGPREPVVLSLTTRAEIEIFAGAYSGAEVYAQRAFDLAYALGDPRGQGLAHLSLAALERFRAERIRRLRERQSLLAKSLEHGEAALQIFAADVPEPERAARARYEQAVTLREQCRLLPTDDPDRRALADRADALFDEAAADATRSRHWDSYLDARLGQVWMHHYLAQSDLAERLDKLWEEIRVELPEYLIRPTSWPGVVDSTVLAIFGQLARYHVLRGVMALDRGNRREAGRQFAVAFEYNRLVARSFRDMNRGVNVVYDRLRSSSVPDMLAMFDGAASALGTLLPQRVSGWIERKEDLVFWRILENHFGSYDSFRRLAV